MERSGPAQAAPSARRRKGFHKILLVCLVVLLSYLSAELGGLLEIYVPQPVWLLWPGCALLVAVLLLVPRGLWPILIASGIAGFVIYDLRVGLSVGSILWLILIDSAEVLTAAFGVAFVFPKAVHLDSLSGLLKYCLFAVFLAPVLTATMGAGVLNGDYWISWRIILFSEALAFLTLPPAILGWANEFQTWRRKPRAYWVEAATLITGVLLFGYLISVTSGRNSSPALFYALVPFLIWSALRFGPFGVSTSVVIVAFLSIWGTIHGRGPFTNFSPLHGALSLQLFLLCAAGPFMVLAALAEERKRTQENLRQGERRLSQAMRAGQLGGWEWESREEKCSWFAGTYRLFGMSSGEELGSLEDFWNHVHPEDRVSLRELMESAAKRRESFDGEFRVVWPDETVHRLASHGTFVFTADGQVDRTLGLLRDTTQHRQAEDALRESEERFRLVADKAPVLIWMSGIDKLFTFFNKGWLDFTGRSMQQELGNGWLTGLHADDLERYLRVYSNAFDARTDFEVECRLRRSDGEYRWIVDQGVPRFAANGAFCGYIGSCLDISDRKAYEASLQELSGRLIIAQEEERRRIARELHDDLSQRMARLQIRLERYEQGEAGILPKSREQLHAIAEMARNVSCGLRELSHLLHPATLASLGLVTAISGMCREFSEQRELQVKFAHSDIPKDIPDETSLCLFRITQEALQNVWKHSGVKDAGVTLLGHADRIDLCVEDTGIGFDQKSSQGKPTLGFVSMQERVRLVSGHLGIDSAPLRGTRIRVQVPLSRLTTQGRGK